MNKEKLLDAFSDFLDNFGGSQEPSEPTVEIVKALDEEKQEALFVALAPDEVDLHGDTYSAEEIAKACESYNRHCMKTNLAHLFMVDDDVSYVLESYIAPVDMQVGETLVTKGTWLQKWKITDEDIWKGLKDGYWNGISIQCTATVEKLDE